MKILFLTYEYPTSMDEAVVSGEVKNPYLLARGIIQRGHDVHVISVPFLTRFPKRVRERQDGDVRITDVPEGRSTAIIRYLWRSANVARYLMKLNVEFDVIHAEAPALAFGVLIARRFRPAYRGIRLVTSGHGTNLPEADADAKVNLRQRLRVMNARLVLPVDRIAFRNSDAVISVSNFQRTELAELYKTPKAKIFVVYNGVDLERYFPVQELSHGHGHESHTRSRGPLRLLFVGRLVPKKGLQHLIRAMPVIAETYPDATLRVVGGSPIFDSFGTELRALASSCGADDLIHWEMSVPETEMPHVYTSSDIAIFPSEGYESLPTVILEAMACGIPVVATRSWGSPEAMGDDHPGLIPESNPDGIIDAVRRFAEDDEFRAAAVERQLTRVRQFSLEKTITAHEEIYEDV